MAAKKICNYVATVVKLIKADIHRDADSTFT